jgi:hypothetical protein
LREIVVHAPDLVGGKCSWHGAREIVGQRRRAHCFDVAPPLVTAAPRVLDLAEQAAIARFDRISQALQAVELAVVVHDDLVGNMLVARHGERLGHDHRGAAARPVRVVVNLALRDASLLAHARRHRRMDDPVPERLAAKGVRGEERRVEFVRAVGITHMACMLPGWCRDACCMAMLVLNNSRQDFLCRYARQLFGQLEEGLVHAHNGALQTDVSAH